MVSPETKQIVLGSGQGSKIEGGIMEFYYCEHCGALYVKANQVGKMCIRDRGDVGIVKPYRTPARKWFLF